MCRVRRRFLRRNQSRRRTLDFGFNESFRKLVMSASKSPSIEAAIAAVLSDHFEHAENPHETIYRIWLLLNAPALTGALPTTETAGTDRDGRSSPPPARYN